MTLDEIERRLPVASRDPMRRAATWVEPDMRLPDGMTCGHLAADEVCDFAPSRFIETVPAVRRTT